MSGDQISDETAEPSASESSGAFMIDPESQGTWEPPRLRRRNWGDLTSAGNVSIRKMKGASDARSDVDIQSTGGADEAAEVPLSGGDNSGGMSWLEIPAPPHVPSGEIIWHYTDVSGFKAILESRCLWATALAFLNDREEFAYGLKIFNEAVADALESRYVHPLQKEFLQHVMREAQKVDRRLRTFVVCASLASDSLAQWRGYASGAGYALGFDPSSQPVVLTDGGDDGLPYGSAEMTWRKVLYERDDQRALADRTLSYVLHLCPTPDWSPTRDESQRIGKMAVAQVVTSSCYIKHPSFVEEQEVRAVLSVEEDEEVLRRVTPYGLAPFLRATLLTSDPGEHLPGRVFAAASLPLKRLMLGPGANEETRLLGAEDFLRGSGYDVSIDLSSSPFR